jgi:protoporphyrinogen oxidase
MEKYKDIIIIGGGVAGLAFANEIIKKNPETNIKIYERDNTIGGCHKVDRKEYNGEFYFCEHAPRIYIGNYVNFIDMLKSMKLDFYNIFTKYKYNFIDISNKIVLEDKVFTFYELLILIRDFLFTILSNDYGLNISMKNYMIYNQFSQKAMKYIDLFCRSTDGGDSSRISLNQFNLSTIQSLLYNIYIPKKPNDEGLFKYWSNYLKANKVEINLNKGVKELSIKDDKIKSIILENGEEIEGDLFILAMPPVNFSKIINIKDAFGDLEEFTKKTKYNDYISMTLFWDYDLKLEDPIFNSSTEWNLFLMIMSNYMKFKESKAKTVISCAIVLTDVKNSLLNKTANECDKDELIESVYNQLLTIFKNIPPPTLYFIHNYYDKDLKKWVSNNTAFIKVPEIDYIDFKSKKYKNLYNLGTHNGKHKNSITSLESAISNSIKLSNIIFEKKTRIKRCFDLRDLTIIIIAILILIFLILHKFLRSNRNK